MNPFKFLAFIAFAYFSLVVIFGSGGDSPPETTVKVPQTVQIVPLTDEQIADREAEIAQMIAEENATIYDEPVETTTTLRTARPDRSRHQVSRMATARRRDGLAQSDRSPADPRSRHVEGIALSSSRCERHQRSRPDSDQPDPRRVALGDGLDT
jgi:hypothetical protein